ncbi:hypothetical protein PUN28_004299 [Cardiocondyla obscurior]|uniref:Uncharacterized protein n=1 Tax=Cardiocondyla obscurior TaxID=286306 RepID=A0AAW2GA05_9HYME
MEFAEPTLTLTAKLVQVSYQQATRNYNYDCLIVTDNLGLGRIRKWFSKCESLSTDRRSPHVQESDSLNT